MKKIIARTICVAAFVCGSVVYGAVPDAAPAGPIIRVCIADNKDALTLLIRGQYTITAADSGVLLMTGKSFYGRIHAIAGGLKLGKKAVAVTGIRIVAGPEAVIHVDGKSFRGEIDIMRKENSRLMAINHIPVEEYLYGVLYHEVSHRWPPEAIKAQAIVARTFALYQISQNKVRPYDVTNDIYSQVYGGKDSERWSTNRAVDTTRGEVLTYNGAILPAYYHATCAGHTEDASVLWNVDLPPLKGVPCNFCTASPHYTWRAEIPLADLEAKLRQNGYKVGKIVSVAVSSRTASKRADKIDIKDNAGTMAIITAKDFRQMLGPNKIRSTSFSLAIRWGMLVVDGLGWGHGVGMCQWGAYGQAREGRTAEEIVRFYYPGVAITTIDKLTAPAQ